MVAVEALVIAVGWAAMFIGMGDGVALVIGGVVPVPVIVVYMGYAVDAATWVLSISGLA